MSGDSGSPSISEIDLVIVAKRARFTYLAEQAANAVEVAAKRVKLAQEMAKQIYESNPNHPGAEETAFFMDEYTEDMAKTWAKALEGKTIFQNSAEVVELRRRQEAQNATHRRNVAAIMGVDSDGLE